MLAFNEGLKMAKIRSLARVQGNSHAHPTEVDAEWSTVMTPGGERLWQLSTFGSDTRASKPKVSQTIQVDAEMARRLQAALAEAFGPNS